MSKDLSRSILLQVAFKGSIDTGGDVDTINSNTITYFTMLENLHKEFGISLADGARSGGRATKQPSETPMGDVFTYEGASWLDNRKLKTAGKLVPNYPDFKSVEGNTSIWMYSQSGEINEEAAALVTAADAHAVLA